MTTTPRTNLSKMDLSGANLQGATLTGADLTGADLRDATLRDATLRDANLGGADLTKANHGDTIHAALETHGIHPRPGTHHPGHLTISLTPTNTRALLQLLTQESRP